MWKEYINLLVNRYESTYSLINICQTLSLERHILQQPKKYIACWPHIFPSNLKVVMLSNQERAKPHICKASKNFLLHAAHGQAKARKDVLIYFLWVKSMWVFEEMIQKCIENSNMICPFLINRKPSPFVYRFESTAKRIPEKEKGQICKCPSIHASYPTQPLQQDAKR